jgi:hypothetical protein
MRDNLIFPTVVSSKVTYTYTLLGSKKCFRNNCYLIVEIFQIVRQPIF